MEACVPLAGCLAGVLALGSVARRGFAPRRVTVGKQDSLRIALAVATGVCCGAELAWSMWKRFGSGPLDGSLSASSWFSACLLWSSAVAGVVLYTEAFQGCSEAITVKCFFAMVAVCNAPAVRSAFNRGSDALTTSPWGGWGAPDVFLTLAGACSWTVLTISYCFIDRRRSAVAPLEETLLDEESRERNTTEVVGDDSTSTPRGIIKQPIWYSSIWNRLMFNWFDPLVRAAVSSPLTPESLFELAEEDTAQQVMPIFDQHWQNEMKRSPDKRSLLGALWRVERGSLLLAWFLHVTGILFQYAPPIVLNALLKGVQSQSADFTIAKGLIMASLLGILSACERSFFSQFQFCQMKCGMRVCATVHNAAFHKILRIREGDSDVSQESTSGTSTDSNTSSSTSAGQTKGGGSGSGELVNLAATDVGRIRNCISDLDTWWSYPLQSGMGLVLLFRYLGPCVIAGIVTIAVGLGLGALLLTAVRYYNVKLMAARDRRLQVAQEVLSSIRLIKMNAWERKFSDRIEELRKEEVRLLHIGNLFRLSSKSITESVIFFGSLSTFGVYVWLGHELDAPTAFTALLLFQMINWPIQRMPNAFQGLIDAKVSLDRFQKLLETPELPIRPRTVLRKGERATVKAQEATLRWPNGDLLLEKLNLTAESGQLVAVVGPTGAGKTGFLQGLIGDLLPTVGDISVEGSIAYCSQAAWIRNASLKNNILFGRPYVADWYAKVVDVCELSRDIEELPAKDETEIGERGINLSGGQKQRVALARAVYADADVYLLDDVLSAVDANVATKIIEKCLMGILRKKCIVMCTHHRHVAEKADKILMMMSDRSSTFGDLEGFQTEAEFEALWTDAEAASNGQEIEASEASRNEGQRFDTASGETAQVTVEDEELRQASLVSTASCEQLEEGAMENGEISPTAKEDLGKLVTREKLASGKISKKVYWSYFEALGGNLWFCAFLIAIIVTKAGDVGSTAWLSYWSDHSDRVTSKTGITLYMLIGMTFVAMQTVSFVVANDGSIRSSKYYHSRLMWRLLRAPVSFFDETPLGRIIQRVTADIFIVDDQLARTFFVFGDVTLGVTGSFLVIAYVTPWIVVLAIPLLWYYNRLRNLYINPARQFRRIRSIVESPVIQFFAESLQGASTIRAYGNQAAFTEINYALNDKKYAAGMHICCSNRWLGARLDFIGCGLLFSTTALAVVSRGLVPAGLVGLAVNNAMTVVERLAFFIRFQSLFEVQSISIERIDEYIRETPQEAPLQIRESRPRPTWPEEGKVKIEKLSLKYRPNLPFVLKGLSLDIGGQQKIGIVGRTGAGKSSVVNCLLRLWEASEGRVLVDGQDIGMIGVADLREKFSIIPQEPLLFIGTLRFNLDPFEQHDDSQIWAALERSHLRSFAEGLTDGLDFKVEEGGRNVSMGQRQLLCLTRALLRNAKIMLLDEATSAVDPQTDALIQETIRTEFKDCTVITIAHRLNTIINYDQVVVLEGGEVVEAGAPQDLMRAKGIFSEMCEGAGLVATATG